MWVYMCYYSISSPPPIVDKNIEYRVGNDSINEIVIRNKVVNIEWVTVEVSRVRW